MVVISRAVMTGMVLGGGHCVPSDVNLKYLQILSLLARKEH